MNVKLYRPLSRRFNWEYSVFGEGKAWLIYDNKYNQEYYVIGNPDALKFMTVTMAKAVTTTTTGTIAGMATGMITSRNKTGNRTVRRKKGFPFRATTSNRNTRASGNAL